MVEFKDVLLDLQVDVVVEKSLSTEISLHEHFKGAHQVRRCHLRHVHR